MTIYDQAREWVRALQQQDYSYITVDDALETLQESGFRLVEGLKGIGALLAEFELDPNKPLGECYADIVKENAKAAKMEFVHKTMLAPDLPESVHWLLDTEGESDKSWDPKGQYHSYTIVDPYADDEYLTATAVSKEALEAALNARLHYISAAERKLPSAVRIITDDDETFYQFNVEGENFDLVRSAVITLFRDHGLRFGHYREPGEFIPTESGKLKEPDDLDSPYDPATRREYLKKITAEKAEEKKLMDEILKDSIDVIRVPVTAETTKIMQDELGYIPGRQIR